MPILPAFAPRGEIALGEAGGGVGAMVEVGVAVGVGVGVGVRVGVLVGVCAGEIVGVMVGALVGILVGAGTKTCSRAGWVGLSEEQEFTAKAMALPKRHLTPALNICFYFTRKI